MGSGTIESAHGPIIQDRMKKSAATQYSKIFANLRLFVRSMCAYPQKSHKIIAIGSFPGYCRRVTEESESTKLPTTSPHQSMVTGQIKASAVLARIQNA